MIPIEWDRTYHIARDQPGEDELTTDDPDWEPPQSARSDPGRPRSTLD